MEKYILDNGLKVIQYKIKNFNSLFIALNIKVGSRYETEEYAGMAHFLEHMIFKGTKKYPTSFDLIRTVDKMGANYNAYTSNENTCYHFNLSKNYLYNILEIIKEMIFYSKFEEKEIKSEINVVLEELKKRSDNPNYYLQTKEMELIFGKNSLGRSVGGYEKVIKKFNRKKILNFYNQYYNTNNMGLIIVGDLPTGLKPKIKTLFDIKLKKYPITINGYKDFIVTQNKNRKKIYDNKNNQTRLVLGFPFNIKADSKDLYIISLLSNILGGNMSSILFRELRDKLGLCYTIGTDIDIFNNTSVFYIHTGTQKKNITKIIKEIYKIIKGLKKNGFSKKDFDDGKNNYINKYFVNIDSVSSIGGYYIDELKISNFKKIENHNKYIDDIKKIKLSDVNKYITKIFDFNKLNLVILN